VSCDVVYTLMVDVCMREKSVKSKRKVESLEFDVFTDDFFVYEFVLRRRAA
jgi:hypothetical protein